MAENFETQNKEVENTKINKQNPNPTPQHTHLDTESLNFSKQNTKENLEASRGKKDTLHTKEKG